MKKFLPIYFIFWIAVVMQPVHATDVSGIISTNTTWTLAGSPYTITGAVTVATGNTLTIQPGVSVHFPASNYGGLHLDVKGTLIAKGVSGKNIIFSGDGGTIDSYPYHYISGPVYIESTSQNSVLQYVTFDALGFGPYQVSDNTSALDISSTSCTVTNCIFQNTRGTALSFANSTTAAVNNNSFNGNRIGMRFGNVSPIVSNNSFSGNSYLDLLTDMDNLGKLKSNGALAIGLTANQQMAHSDTLAAVHSYRVLAALVVSSGNTLTIQPGVSVHFPASNYGGLHLDVKGTLIAKGVSGKNIIFSGDGGTIDSYPYHYISGPVYIESTSQNSVLQYVTFDALGFGPYQVSDNTSALDISSTSCTVTNCIFQNTRGTALSFANSTTAAVNNNSFNGNRIGMRFGNVSPIVSNNSFSGNSYLDLLTDMDNLGKLKSNGALAIGLTANQPMAHSDTLAAVHSYRVLAALVVSSGNTLTIQPGVSVHFPASNYGGLHLDVKGTLIAKGVSGKNIIFSGDGGTIDSYPYHYISGPVYIESTSQNSVLQYVTFDALGFGPYQVSDNTSALDISSTSCTVTNCIFQNTRGTALSFANSTTAAVNNNSFNGNRIGMRFGNVSPIVSNNSFSGNSYLDLLTDMDNLGKLKSNGALAIGLTANQPMAHSDTLAAVHSYRVLAALVVSSGNTLTIQPGVSVHFPASNYGGLHLDVKGTLIAKGVSGKNIIFSGDGGTIDSYPYHYISGPVYIESTSQNSVLQYVTFDALGFGPYQVSDNTSVLDISSTSCTVTNCIFQNIRGVGIFFGTNTFPKVSNNNFFGNTNGDITSDALSLKNISNNNNATINILASTISQNATWPNPGASSKYLLKGNIIVSPTYKLTIAAGTKVLFNDNSANLVVQGTLIANGTKEDKIKFESAGAAFGGTISFDSTSKNSSLIYVITSKLGSTILPARSAAIELKTSSILIRNISISNSEQNGLTIKKGNPVVQQSIFLNNKTGVLSLAGKAKFNRCSFIDNSLYGINNISAIAKDTIDARNCWWGDATGPHQDSTNPAGLGDTVSAKVLYQPFLSKPLEQNDIGVLAILSPVSSCDLSSAERITVRIKNYGTEEQSVFNVSYQINNLALVTESDSLKLPGDSSATFTFTKPADLSLPGRSYTLKVFTALPGDTIFSNDSKVSVIKNQKPNLGKDTALKICKEGFINLWKLYDTSGYTTKKWFADKPDSAGVGNFTLIVTTSNGCLDTAVATITAYDLPTPTIVAYGNTIFCKGGDVNLESSPAPGYLWSNGAVTRNIKVTESGNYYVTTRNDSGCKATSAATLVEVKETIKPAITVTKGTLNLCPGASVTLRASSSPDYYYYAWSTSDTTQSITVDTTGIYTVTVTGSNGCKNTSAPVVVTDTCAKPRGLAKSQVTDSSAKLSWNAVNCAAGYSFRYKKTGTSVWTTRVITGNSYTITGLTGNTSYDWAVASICQSAPLIQSGYTTTLKFTTLAGFASRSTSKEKETGIGKLLSAVVYPVPVVNNSATLLIENSGGKSTVRLSDLSGKLLWQMNEVNDGRFVLPIAKYSAGIYIVNVYNEKDNVTIKIVKE